MLTQPSIESFIWLTVAVAVWIALSLGLQTLASKFGSEVP